MPDSSPRRNIARLCRALSKGTHDSDLLRQLQQWAVECDGDADAALGGAYADELLERARRHRLRAEEYRAVLDQMRHPDARCSYRHLAETYDAMARQLEEAAGSRADEREVG